MLKRKNTGFTPKHIPSDLPVELPLKTAAELEILETYYLDNKEKVDELVRTIFIYLLMCVLVLFEIVFCADVNRIIAL